MGRKRRKVAVVQMAVTPERIPPELTPEMLGLAGEELQTFRQDEMLRKVGVIVDAAQRYHIDLGDEDALVAIIYRLAMELDDLKRGVTRDRRKWAPAMNAALHASVMAAAKGGPIREAIFEDLFEGRASLDFIPPTVGSAEAIKSQFKKVDRLLKEARASYRPYSEAEKLAIANVVMSAAGD